MNKSEEHAFRCLWKNGTEAFLEAVTKGNKKTQDSSLSVKTALDGEEVVKHFDSLYGRRAAFKRRRHYASCGATSAPGVRHPHRFRIQDRETNMILLFYVRFEETEEEGMITWVWTIRHNPTN